MKSFKQQFTEFKETTPKYVQWLLLVAAFVVVVILLILIINEKPDTPIVDAKKTVLSFKPQKLDFLNIKANEKSFKKATLSVSGSAIIEEVYIEDDKLYNLDVSSDCPGIKEDAQCTTSVTYSPNAAQKQTKTFLVVKYHLPDKANTDKQTVQLPIEISAVQKEDKKPEPVAEVQTPQGSDEVVDEPEIIDEPVEPDIPDEPNEPEEPAEPDIPDEPNEPEEPAELDIPDEPFVAPAPDFPKEKPTTVIPLPSEKCSDFAIPGYNKAGVQIGWIKPSHGANYFHPFADKDCLKPTGKYDWTTGVITSLKDGSKIGTDADHIGFKNVKSRGLSLPNLSEPTNKSSSVASNGHYDEESTVWSNGNGMRRFSSTENGQIGFNDDDKDYRGSAYDDELLVSSRPYDRTFILRQFKPIPATIVSEVRADPSVYGCTSAGECDPSKEHSIPVRATVDRNVYSDNGRTIIIPTGTLLMGYLTGTLPGPYQSFGRMNIKWYQFIRPDGVEFNFDDSSKDPYSGDAQGRVGVPGRGSTDYIEQMVMPILTAIVPAAVNMIAPIADTFVNQINLDSNTVVQSGTMRSSEMAKQELINQWNRITNKLVVDAISNTVPPFSIPAGTRINVYSPIDLAVTCGDPGTGDGKKCAIHAYSENNRRRWKDIEKPTIDINDKSWVGQVRSWDMSDLCVTDEKTGKTTIDEAAWRNNSNGYDYRTVLLYCESQTYRAKNMERNDAYHNQQVQQYQEQYGTTQERYDDPDKMKAYNQDILGLQYDDDGLILNPFEDIPYTGAEEEEIVTCSDGTSPDENGCCAGETYTDKGEDGFLCCPDDGGEEAECFPPLTME